MQDRRVPDRDTAPDAARASFGPVTGDRSYDNGFPNVQARYDFTRRFVLRASYNRSIGRQNFACIIPGLTISEAALIEDVRVDVNNPDLEPVIFDIHEAPGTTPTINAPRRDTVVLEGRTRQYNIDGAVLCMGVKGTF